MKNFIYDIPTKVYFGKDEELNVGKYLKEFGATKVLLHYGGHSAEKSGLLDKVRKAMKDENIPFVELGGVRANPSIELVRKGVKLAIDENVDFVLAVGGGSVMDSSKAISHGAANPGVDEWDIQTKKVPFTKSLKKGCILTLAAAGSEMSDSCVISNDEVHAKKGINCPQNRMCFAIEDPCLTFSVPKYQTACGAVDISMHTIERYFNVGDHTDLPDAIAEAVIRENNKAGKICCDDPNNYEARATMMWASSLAHNDLTGLGRGKFLQLHQFEHVMSAVYPSITHGAGLAALWPSWARYNMKYNKKRWAKYAENVWGVKCDPADPDEGINKAIDMQENYYRSIGMPVTLRELSDEIKESDIEKFADMVSENGNRVLPGPKPLDRDDILAIFKMAY
ncbi:MAG: iron-containing alcohol dehydrogenase [Lachnospiraceae bacterium]|nr:MAG: iron-containing alcohol dehydrogenase [Lachnospiraceae bacterium]